jgi:hypothetical protein
VGAVVQRVSTSSGAVATGSTTVPVDDTIPQNTEGNAVSAIDTAITPKSTTHRLRIEVVVVCSHGTDAANLVLALFQDSTANALAATGTAQSGSNTLTTLRLTYEMAAGTTSATTFKARVGSGTAGTVTINGTSSARLFGGVMSSIMTITECKA